MEPDERACPYCAETIKVDAVKCKHCGEWLGERETPLQVQRETAPLRGAGRVVSFFGYAVLTLGGLFFAFMFVVIAQHGNAAYNVVATLICALVGALLLGVGKLMTTGVSYVDQRSKRR